MDIRFQNLGPENWHGDAAIVLCPAGEDMLEYAPTLDKACPWLAIAPALRDFRAKKGEVAVFHGFPDLKIPRVVAVGLGELAAVDLGLMREAMARAAQKCQTLNLTSAVFPVSQLEHLPGGRDRLVQELVYAFLTGLYRFQQFKTKKDEAPLQWLALGLDEVDDNVQRAARLGEGDAAAQALARDLANAPANVLYPATLAEKARQWGEAYGFRCEILEEEALSQLGANCILAVGRGSCHPPRLVILEYAPMGAEPEKPLVLVGKGLTFDSGGLCLKSPAHMDQMKCDMSGAAAVLATMAIAAQERVPRRLIGLLACAENMPDGAAYRPGDVLVSLKGDTVEVVNTDAEGRLVLADALAYAQRQWMPEALVDIATLTGACAVALGTQVAGLFSDDDSFAQRIAAFGAAGGENYWRMPLWPGYEDSLQSKVADIKHTASREGGAITAALFLKHFIPTQLPWAHLDIAGVDWQDKDSPLCPEGARGFGVRTLLALARGGWR